ncbi:hypothetical protein GCM10010495_73710 [Kitasatospora herbaricolor]|uniref:PH domain-containing protein n=1 Tax=Kitasatospora herbaricolor TaxID=68217 RepID=UPI00174C2FF2|nr:PH domain-containing protein [Kitasatospora herbaricolor]MDQ0305638.1 hypothetical protein [Kitasatospora herbaricolor]GGV45422.1 hypothetical protein GCM10010495_73710 [Kitasatospora herbaricolor]
MNVYRNPHYRLAGVVLAVIGIVLAVSDRSVIARFPDRDSTWRIALYTAMLAGGIRVLTMRVVATADTLTVRNLLRTHVLPWEAVAGFALESSLVVELKDGRRIGCSAVPPTGLDRMTGRKGYAGTESPRPAPRRGCGQGAGRGGGAGARRDAGVAGAGGPQGAVGGGPPCLRRAGRPAAPGCPG